MIVNNKNGKKTEYSSSNLFSKENKYTIVDFQLNLSYKTWESILGENDVTRILNSFLNVFLRNLYSSFPLIQIDNVGNNSFWITPGIIISCKYNR